ncbi:MAG: 50S ribosomal protein L4 [Dehalococcoidia bacterium]|nr:50S ribosomal protein L4 [Dehalococcoidia bacterium]MDD5494632.1 50S ribosomal protein L4 [Dehalococcoidia bacterium]
MELEVFNLQGEKTGKVKVSDYIFAAPVNEAVVHQALVRQLANRRQGTADTQTRSDVKRSTRKMYQQKHTGRARRGSATSPLLKGGSVVFGPHPRDYRQAMPKKMRRLALRSVLSGKVKDGEIKIVEKWELAEPKTGLLSDILGILDVYNTAIIGVALSNDYLTLAASNIPGIKTTMVSMLNVADLLAHKMLVLDLDAVKKIEELWDQKETGKAKAN